MQGTVITNKGLQLIAKLVASGTALSFTRAAVGIGSVPSGYDPTNMTGLNKYKMNGAIASCGSSGDTASIVFQISSIGVSTGFTITEAGLFATDPDEGEILYCYLDMSSDPQYIYAEGSAISKFVEMTLTVVIGSVQSVTAYINPGSLLTNDGDISNTKVSSFTSTTASYPIPAANDTVKVGFGKIKKFFEDIRNAATGACFIGNIVNNCVTNNAKLPLSAAQGKALMDLYTQLNSDLGDVKTDISLQPVTGIDILTLTTGRYYATNCTNLPTGWVAAYLDVERLDNKWCRITAWPPYDGLNSPQITKQDNGTWRGWKDIMDDKISFEGVGKVTFAQNSSATSIRFYTTAVNYLYIEFLTATKNIKFGFYNGATWTDYWIM